MSRCGGARWSFSQFLEPQSDQLRGFRALTRAARGGGNRGGRLRLTIAEINERRDRVGDRLQFLPGGTQATVKTIERWHAPPQESAGAGDSIGLTFTDQPFLRRGDIASALQDPPWRSSEFEARLFWLGARPLALQRRYRFKLATQEFDGEIETVASVVDAATLAPVDMAGAPGIGTNCVADVTIRTRQPLSFCNRRRWRASKARSPGSCGRR